jgi:hypothetical protein
MRPLFLISIFLVSTLFIQAQEFERLPIKGYVNGKELLNPWAGGLNRPQFSMADLNQNGIQDIYIFDKSAHLSMGFEGFWDQGQKKYRLNMDLVAHFPKFKDFGLLRDYNGDGISDLFCSHNSIGGFRVFKGRFENKELKFDQMLWSDQSGLAGDALWFYQKSNNTKVPQLYVPITDIPAVFDIDGDGDLDILTFDPAGFTMHWYKNHSIELGYGMDTLIMYQETKCWGGFYESGVTPEVELSPVKGECYQKFDDDDSQEHSRELRHTGSTTLALDATGNGLTDIILGDISFNQLVLLINGGDDNTAWIIDQDANFPFQDVPFDVVSFPAAFHFDYDGDGAGDIIATVSAGGTHEDTDQVWFYKNTGSDQNPNWSFSQKDLMLDEMFDFGSGTSPAFFDYDGDGMMDIVTGMYNRYKPGQQYFSSFYLFRNVGTPHEPTFELVDSNYLDFQRFCDSQGLDPCGFSPYFYDIDQDGDLDLLATNAIGELIFSENIAGPGNPAEFADPIFQWLGIRAGNEAIPFVYDLDGDGLPDLMFGLRAGRIMFYKNVGSVGDPQFISDDFDPVNSRVLGGINTRGSTCLIGASSPQVVYENGVKKIIVGSDCNNIQSYIIDTVNIYNPYILEQNHPVSQIKDGRYLKPAFADLNGDNMYEMVVGNIRGGLSFYGTPFRADSEIVSSRYDIVHQAPQIMISPNPFSSILILDFQSEFSIPINVQILDLTGVVVYKSMLYPGISELDLSHLQIGMYFVKAEIHGQSTIRKVVKIN